MGTSAGSPAGELQSAPAIELTGLAARNQNQFELEVYNNFFSFCCAGKHSCSVSRFGQSELAILDLGVKVGDDVLCIKHCLLCNCDFCNLLLALSYSCRAVSLALDECGASGASSSGWWCWRCSVVVELALVGRLRLADCAGTVGS